jgi:ribosomal protein L44E
MNLKISNYGNKDDIERAVFGLDTFTKNWCMNCKETEKQNDLVFRCKECEFQAEDEKCLVKMFAHRHKHNYPMGNLGSMGSL